jgi:large subunit ribosomal protein L30
MLHIKLVKSTVGHKPRNRATVKALGLRKIRQVVYHEDTPTIRGMIHHVKFLLDVSEAPAPEGYVHRPKSVKRAVKKAAPKAKAAVAAAPKAKAEVEKAPAPKAEAKVVAEPKVKVEAKTAAAPKPKATAKPVAAKPKAAAKPAAKKPKEAS